MTPLTLPTTTVNTADTTESDGGTAPRPVIVLVELPPLAVAKMTLLVKPPALPGANCTMTFVAPPPGMLKLLPDAIVNGPPVTVAVPLLTVVPPRLLTVNVRCEVVPV